MGVARLMQRYGDSTAQTVSGVLDSSQAVPAAFRAYFHDERRLRATVEGVDHVLYRAQRDVLAPRWGVGDHDRPPRPWRLDRVFYPAEDLPSGELNRSIGHWNPADQWEVFQVDRGEVVLVVRAPGPGRPTELVRCGTGTVLPVLPGSWHLTYVWQGPAVVTNAYSVPAEQAAPGKKYFTRGPLRCGLRREGREVLVFRDRTDPVQDSGPPVWRSAEQVGASDLPPLESVFAGGPAADRMIARLEEHFARRERRSAG